MGRMYKTDGISQGKQHFSHPHVLKLVNPAELVLTLTCNACEKTNKNNTFYGCNSCQYYLHENCLNAPRFLNHSSHPSHQLKLVVVPNPSYQSGSYRCDACGFSGKGFSYGCSPCQFDIHLECASCPSLISVDKHPHQLELLFGSPYEDKDTEFCCDICDASMNKDNWLYYCAKCDFAAHLHCAIPDKVNKPPLRQQQQNPNPNPNAAVNMINSANEAHDQLMASMLESRIMARSREAILDLWD